MSTYFLINILIISIPLIMSFEKKVRYIKKLPYVLFSIILVGIIFISWDISAVKNGDWSFNPEYITGKTIVGLPFEEILFFITVPYSIIFIYESIKVYINEKYVVLNRIFLFGCLLLFAAASLLFKDQSYTSSVMISVLIIFTALLFKPISFQITNIFLITLLVSYIPFIIVNYFLTALPVLEYNPSAITGIRFITIPAEDFLYSFSMICAWLLVYLIAKNNIRFKN